MKRSQILKKIQSEAFVNTRDSVTSQVSHIIVRILDENVDHFVYRQIQGNIFWLIEGAIPITVYYRHK